MSGPDSEVLAYIADLEQRLKAAEIVCTLLGWQATDRTTDLGKATIQAWQNWVQLYPERESPREQEWRDLIAEYAAERDRRVQETLDSIGAKRITPVTP